MIKLRNNINKGIYKGVIKKILFIQDPEKVHNRFIKVGSALGKSKITKGITSVLFNYQNKMLEQNIFGIRFRNPVGLSAGFDKNAELISIMENVGFGFAETGSVTALPHSGNEGIRLKRLPEKNSIWVNMGLNNKG